MTKKVTINLRDSLYKELDKEARKDYETVAGLIEKLASSYIRRKKALKESKKKKVSGEKIIAKNRRIFR